MIVPVSTAKKDGHIQNNTI